jgi:hypothetical protein
MFVDYTGTARKWQAEIWRSIQANKRNGIFDEIRKKQGRTITISDKGRAILDHYDRKYRTLQLDARRRRSKRWNQGLNPDKPTPRVIVKTSIRTRWERQQLAQPA